MSFSDRKTTGVERSAKGTIDNLTRESIIDKVIFELGIEGCRNEQGMGPYIPAEHYATQRQGTVIMHGVSGEVPKTHDTDPVVFFLYAFLTWMPLSSSFSAKSHPHLEVQLQLHFLYEVSSDVLGHDTPRST